MDSSDDDIELSDQDLNILDEFETKFLMNLQSNGTGALNRRPEVPFTKLPIKNEKGILERVKEVPAEVVKNVHAIEEVVVEPIREEPKPKVAKAKGNQESKKQEKKETNESNGKVKSVQEVTKAKAKPTTTTEGTKSMVEIKEFLAHTASNLVEDPEQHIAELKSLAKFVGDKRAQAVQLSLLTLLAVFKDIIPGYRIRKTPESEQNVQLSKEVRKLRNFEEALLNNYQSYLQTLDKVARENSQSNNPKSNPALYKVAVVCMCELLTSQTHFNFRVNLMTAIVQHLITPTNLEISKICSDCLSTIFTEDTSGVVSLECVKIMTQKIHASKYVVSTMSLEPFLSLKFQTELPTNDSNDQDSQEKRDKSKKRKKKLEPTHVSKKQRKLNKHMKEAMEEFKEAEAAYDKSAIQKHYSETLKHVFMTYFRILKNANQSPLIPMVLEGLAKFARLINVDFFDDLLKVLKSISKKHQEIYLSGADGDSPIVALHCIIAAFELLDSVGGALKVDISDFYEALYTQMSRMSVTIECFDNLKYSYRKRNEIQLLLKGIDFMLKKNREVPIERVAAFVKRLATLCLTIPSSYALTCLPTIKAAVKRFPRLESLLDEDGRVFTGVYNPMMEDPDMCNPFATTMWEISILASHYHPGIKALARHILGKNLTGMQQETQSTNLDIQKLLKSKPATESFTLEPKVKIPDSIRSKAKKKKRLDGPYALYESEFFKSLCQE